MLNKPILKSVPFFVILIVFSYGLSYAIGATFVLTALIVFQLLFAALAVAFSILSFVKRNRNYVSHALLSVGLFIVANLCVFISIEGFVEAITARCIDRVGFDRLSCVVGSTYSLAPLNPEPSAPPILALPIVPLEILHLLPNPSCLVYDYTVLHILERLGVESRIVWLVGLKHAILEAKVNGKWYAIDPQYLGARPVEIKYLAVHLGELSSKVMKVVELDTYWDLTAHHGFKTAVLVIDSAGCFTIYKKGSDEGYHVCSSGRAEIILSPGEYRVYDEQSGRVRSLTLLPNSESVLVP